MGETINSKLVEGVGTGVQADIQRWVVGRSATACVTWTGWLCVTASDELNEQNDDHMRRIDMSILIPMGCTYEDAIETLVDGVWGHRECKG